MMRGIYYLLFYLIFSTTSIYAEVENKNDPALYSKLASEFVAKNNPKEALEAINRAIQLNPKNVEYWNTRGVLANWLKNPKLMLESYQQAHKLDPENLPAILGLARAYVQISGQMKKAAEFYALYLSKNITDKEALLEYAQVQLWLGNLEKGKTLLEDYKTRFGDSEKYQAILKNLTTLSAAAKVKKVEKKQIAVPKKVVAPKKIVKNAQYYQGISQNYAAKNKPQEALQAINQALTFEPNNMAFLKAKGQLAGWAGNFPMMQATYEKILRLEPNNLDGILGMARSYAWQGKSTKAIVYYRKYLHLNPRSREALIELSEIYRPMGNYRESRHLLFTYRSYFGETKQYRAQLALLYASAKWYQSAQELIDPLLLEEPKNFNYLVTKAYTEYAARQYRDSFDTLSVLRSLKPKAPETRFLSRYLTTPTRSFIQLGEQGIGDTHTVRISETGLQGYSFFTPETAVRIAGLFEYAKATDPAYIPVRGGDSIYDISGKIGLFHRIAPYLDLGADVGALDIKTRSQYLIYNVDVKWWINEKLWLRYAFSHNLFRPDQYTVFSPRLISLAIMQNDNLLYFHAEPALQRYLDILFEYNPISDGNQLRHINIWPSMRLLSAPGLLINWGFNADLYSFTKTNLNGGYYSPHLAQTYLATLNLYHGFNENSGITFSSGLGMQKDETLSRFYLASDISADVVIGFFSDWQFELIGAYSYRGNPTRPYRVVSGRGVLTRRF